MRVVLAIPTIPERPGAAEEVHELFQLHSCQPITAIATTDGESWCGGLNAVYRGLFAKEKPFDAMICGSDDMVPVDDNWLPPLLDYLARGALPAPTVIDPTWTNYGGHTVEVPDGTPSLMSTFPVLHREWTDYVFPLPENLHYYGDNLIAVKLRQVGIDCVAVTSSRIRHRNDERGRGAGAGSQANRMMLDEVNYTMALRGLGLERKKLPPNLAGPVH